jgi:CHAD domain-containing protein
MKKLWVVALSSAARSTQVSLVNGDPQASPPNKLQLAAAEPLAEAAARSIRFFRDVMLRQHDAAIAGEIEPVHQLRVSSRRLRAAIELFAGVLYAASLKTYRRDVPWIARQAGAVRNCDVLEILFKEREAKLHPTLRDSLAPLNEAIAAERKATHAQLVHDLSSRRYANLAVRLAAPAIKTARGRARLGIAAPDLVAPMIRGIRKKGAKLAEDAPAEVFHKLRVRIKRLRYAFEMLAALAGKRHRKILERLEDLQELLGTYNDTNVAIAWLHSFASSAAAPASTVLAAGAMIQSLGSRAVKLRGQCLKAWQRFDRSEVLEDAMGEILTTAQHLAAAERAAAHAARLAQAQAELAASLAADGKSGTEPISSWPAPDSAPEAPQIAIASEIGIVATVPAAAPEPELEPAPKPDDTEHAA